MINRKVGEAMINRKRCCAAVGLAKATLTRCAVAARVLAVAGLVACANIPAVAQTPEQFYAGRSVNLIVPFSAGGYYDIGARLLARHLGRHIAGKPGVVVQNQPGGGGIGLANRFGAGADKDGATLAMMQRAIPQVAIMGDPNAKYDPLKITWLGSLSGYATDAYLLFVNPGHRAKTGFDLRQAGVKAVLGANRSGSTNLMLALVARDVLKLNVDIVRGFPGANDITLAQQRGEVDGQMADLSILKAGMGDMWTKSRVTVLIQFARTARLPELADVPTAREMAHDAAERALIAFAEIPFFMALPLAGPAGMPPDRAKAVADGFMALAGDQEFLADAAKIGYPADLVSAADVMKLVEEAARTPKDVVERYRSIVSQQ